jgi:hypothetical protein
MYIKIVTLSALTASLLVAGIDITVLGKSRGGNINESDAIKDGIGYIVNTPTNVNKIIDTKEYNKALYEHAEKVDYSTTTFKNFISTDSSIDPILKNEIIEQSIDSTSFVEKLNKLKASDPTLKADGTPCDDGNLLTTGEKYLNGACQGGIVENNTPCDDGNTLTNGDIYTNNVCSGYYSSCATILQDNPGSKDGSYTIYPSGGSKITVACDDKWWMDRSYTTGHGRW